LWTAERYASAVMSSALATATVSASPQIGVRAITGFLEFFQQKGGDPDALLRELGLSRALFADPEGRLPLAAFVALFERASERSRDDCFGAHFALCYPLQYTGLAGHVTRHAPTLGIGCRAIARYYSLLADSSRISSVIWGDQAKLSYQVTDASIRPRRQDAECMMAVLLAWLRETLGTEFSPDEVWFEHAEPAGAAELASIFRAPLRFEQTENALLFPRAHLAAKVRSADDELHQLLKARVEELMRQKMLVPGLVASVRETICATLDDSLPTLDTVAARLTLGPRTLQRRLREVGQSFQQVFEEARHDLALRYLANPELSVTDVAMRLGYADATAFNRAFRRWTGSAPSSHRR
jgi:AraC-like DNA-binding protein